MATVVTFNSLSGVTAPELNYTYKFSEELNKESIFFSNQFAYNKYEIFKNLQDAAISKHNIAFLTDQLQLSSAFEEQPMTLTISSMPSLVHLKQLSGSLYFHLNGTDVIGNSSLKTPMFFVLTEDNQVEIRVSIDSCLEVSKEYPYKIYKAKRATLEEQIKRQRFELDVSGSTLTLKANTSEGSRFVAFDCSSKLRATGLMLNDVSTNNYLFSAVPISRAELNKGTQAEMEFIKYFNTFETLGNKKNVYIQESETTNTHWLITTTLNQVAKSSNGVNVNLMPLKTNFTPTGTFLTKPNE